MEKYFIKITDSSRVSIYRKSDDSCVTQNLIFDILTIQQLSKLIENYTGNNPGDFLKNEDSKLKEQSEEINIEEQIQSLEQAEELGYKAWKIKKGVWCYKDFDGFVHLFEKDVELTKGIKTKRVYYISKGKIKILESNGKYSIISNF